MKGNKRTLQGSWISFMHLHHVVNRGQKTSTKHPLFFTCLYFNKAPLLFLLSFLTDIDKVKKINDAEKKLFLFEQNYTYLQYLCTK